MALFYRPADGVAADFVPFYEDGLWHLFYLKDYRDREGHGEGTPWFHLVTRDMVHFQDWGEALPRGTAEEQDLYVFTGSVVAADDRYHIYYTGHNPHLAERGRPVQGVMRATSADLRTWQKDDLPVFLAPVDAGYEPDDWRDPFVFWNDEASEYWMLLAARRTEGPSRYRGCTALATSRDLARWEVREPFWAPHLYYTHECPDLFRWGDWWYLLYSTFSERTVTHYRMSRSLEGPWLAPPRDTLDARAHYAAKTAFDGETRYLFGWLATREGESDEGRWQWGGNLVAHEVVRSPDGTLGAKAPDSVLAYLRGEAVPLDRQEPLGSWQMDGDAAWTEAGSSQALLRLGIPREPALLETRVIYAAGTQACGLVLRLDDAAQSWYELRLEPQRQRIVVDRWPRPGDAPFMLEQPLASRPEEAIQLRVLIEGDCLVAYANDEAALSCRVYDHPAGAWGLFVRDGAARFEDLAAHAPS